MVRPIVGTHLTLSNAFSGQDFIDLVLDETDWAVIGVSRSAQLPAFRLKYLEKVEPSRVTFMQADMNSDMPALLEMFDREQPAYIINFAAQSEVAPSWEHPEHWFATNTVALSRLVNHLARQNYVERYLHVSSPEVYGPCVGVVREDAPMNPSTPYAASKAAADMLLETYRKQFGFPLLTVRATNVYGARQQLFKIIPRSVIYIRSGQVIELHGGGKAVKSYINIRDVSRGELAILRDGEIGELYHLSPPAGVAVCDVVSKICDYLDTPFDEATRVVGERPGQDAAYVIDSTKAAALLNWSPTIGIDAGLSEVVEWVDENWADIKAQSLTYDHKP